MQNYTIYDEIGRGTTSFVYKARRKRSIEYVAVKSTDKTRMDKILNEVQILHRLDSRHVLKFFNWYESTNHIWLIFEYCIGGDLLKLITQDRRLPEPAVKAFGWQLVAGLQYLHANSILYCDLKPANILIDECGSLKLADFGIARRIPTAESILTTPLAPGSPNYMAPELFQPPAIHSFASDFWALGCVLFELVTGRQPFTHTFFPELARIIQTEPLVMPTGEIEISRDFADLLHKLLEKDPYRRITWQELRAHRFWAGCAPLDEVELPAQELFEAAGHERQHEIVGESLSIAIPSPQHAKFEDHDLSEEKPATSPATESTSDRSPSSRPSENDDDDNSDREAEDSIHRSETDNVEDEDNFEDMLSGEDKAYKRRPVTAPLPKGATVERDLSHKGRGTLTERSESSKETGKARVTRTAPVGVGRRQPLLPSTARRQSLTKVSKLLFLAADSALKPIAYSDDIERSEMPHVEPDHLDFDALAAEELLACATEDLEDHLKSIYISLKSNDSSATEKTNVLAHLFSLSLHPRLANVIVNSSLLGLLIKLLNHGTQNMASPSTHVKRDALSVTTMITQVLGVLFRFATFISSTSPDNIQALVARLSDIVGKEGDDSNTKHGVLELKAKRNAMACLGELLFYLATQEQAKLPATGANVLVKILDDSDVVTRHYAIRTIANILTQSAGVAPALVHEHVVHALLRSLLKPVETPRGEGAVVLLQTSTMQALAQVFRHIRLTATPTPATVKTKVAVMMALWKASVLSSLWDGVVSGKSAPDLAIASLNVLNAYLEMNLDQHDDEGAQAIVTKHKRTLLKKIVKVAVLESLLEAKSKFEEDDQILRVHRTEENTSGHRRYTDDGRALPSLLRAKTLLFLYFAIQRSGEFARLFVREQLLDKVELLLVPYGATLRAGGYSPTSSSSTSSRNKGSDSTVSSPRQLPPTDQYLVHCGLNLVRLCIRTALKMGAECVSSSDKVDYDGETNGKSGSPMQSSVASEPFQLIDQLVTNPTCRGQLCQYFLVHGGKEFRFFVRLMSKLLTSFATEKLVAMGATVSAVISRLLLRLFRGSPSEAAALVVAEAEEIFTHLLPAIVVQLLHADTTQHNDGEHAADEDDEDNDHSVNCIQLVHVVMVQLPLDLTESLLSAREQLARRHLLPCFQALFGHGRLNENVWRGAIDLLHALVIYDPQLVDDFEASGLIAPTLSLLSSPKEHQYHSLPASASALVKMLVEVSNKASTISLLHDHHHVARHITDGLEFAVKASALTTGTVDLLDTLYLLLYHRYEERRKDKDSSASPDFEHLVWTGPLLIHLCASADGSMDDTATNGKRDHHHDVAANSAAHEILESASRCLVYVSQLFGSHLNDVLFEKARSPSHKDRVTRDLAQCLRLTQHEAVLLRVLLTIKNSLRCVKKHETPFARRWLQSDRSAMSQVVRISNWERKSPSSNPEQNRSRDQVIKAAQEILSFFQTTIAATTSK